MRTLLVAAVAVFTLSVNSFAATVAEDPIAANVRSLLQSKQKST